MTVPLERVDATLASLWDQAAQQGRTATHARTANVIAICETADDHPRVCGVLQQLLVRHPGRGVLVVPYEPDAASRSITASVELVVDTTRKNLPVAELVTLDVRGEARAWVPTAVERLLSPGAPSYLWWVGDLPDRDTLFDKLVETSDAALFDSSLMDLRDLPTLARMTEWGRGSFFVGDLGWSWLRLWQDLLARFFDDPAMRAELSAVRDVCIRCAPHRLEPVAEPASTQGALLAGWLLAQLGADAEQARWTSHSESEHVVIAPAGDHAITVRFATEPRDDVPMGALLRVVLHTESGGQFTVAREPDDADTYGWHAEAAGITVPPTVWRSRTPDASLLLARALDVPESSRALFVRSLRAAAALSRAVEPAFTRRPR